MISKLERRKLSELWTKKAEASRCCSCSPSEACGHLMARGHPRQATAVRCIWASSSVCDGAASANGEAASASGGHRQVLSTTTTGATCRATGRRLQAPTTRRGKKGASNSTSTPSSPWAPTVSCATVVCGTLQPPPPSIDGFWPRPSRSSGAGHSPQGNQAANMW